MSTDARREAVGEAQRRSAQSLTGDHTLVLPEFDHPPTDPLDLLGQWLTAAETYGVSEPYAFVLSTVDTHNRPSSRVVLLKGTSDQALIFGTSSTSRKGRDIKENAWVSASFHWRETLQQITATGRANPLSGADSDNLFAERPRNAQAAAVVSKQSNVLTDEGDLQRHASRLAAQESISRPSDWHAYAITVDRIEFWQGRADRLHRRLEYQREVGGWSHRRLQP